MFRIIFSFQIFFQLGFCPQDFIIIVRQHVVGGSVNELKSADINKLRDIE